MFAVGRTSIAVFHYSYSIAIGQRNDERNMVSRSRRCRNAVNQIQRLSQNLCREYHEIVFCLLILSFSADWVTQDGRPACHLPPAFLFPNQWGKEANGSQHNVEKCCVSVISGPTWSHSRK